MRRRKIEVQKVGQKHQKITFFSRAAALKIGFSRRLLENFGYFGAARRYQKA